MFLLYVLPHCPYCNNALALLDKHTIPYKKVIVETNEEKEKYKKKNKMNTFPQIFFKKQKIGGFDKLKELIETFDILKKKDISMEALAFLEKRN